jgi:hypothetical protein
MPEILCNLIVDSDSTLAAPTLFSSFATARIPRLARNTSKQKLSGRTEVYPVERMVVGGLADTMTLTIDLHDSALPLGTGATRYSDQCEYGAIMGGID